MTYINQEVFGPRMRHTSFVTVGIAAAIAALMVLVLVPAGSNAQSASTTVTATPLGAGHGAIPAKGELDCNGDSSLQHAIRPQLICIDPRGPGGPFYDNWQYVGHDEPNMRFISNAPGSANNMEYRLNLPVQPTTAAGVATYQDTPTFWFGLAVCDNNSFPQQTCINDSDLNTGLGISATDAGSAVVELQFYAPSPEGFFGCQDGPTTTASTQYCVALNIDSLECDFTGGCNPACTEPVNFAYLTTNGVPVAPPSPQLSNINTFIGNQTPILRMAPGDQVEVFMHDTPSGLFAGVLDRNSGAFGWTTASAANGFQDTNLVTCAGTPYNFHPEYDTAAVNNIVPWAALMLGPSLDVETGHYEACDADLDDACVTVGSTTFSFGTDTDFDGVPYQTNGWSVKLSNGPHHAGAINLLDVVPGMFGPASLGGGVKTGYPIYELETDIGLTLFELPTGPVCDLLIPNSCSVDNLAAVGPTYAGFYPFFSTKGCTAAFGDLTAPGWHDHGGIKGFGPTQASFQGTIALWITNGAFYTNSC